MLNPVSGELAPRKIARRLGIGVWVKVRVSFRVGGNQTIAIVENWPLVKVRVSFGVGGRGDKFPRGQLGGDNCPRTVRSFHVGFFLKKLLMGVSVYRGLDLRIFFSFFCFLHFILR